MTDNRIAISMQKTGVELMNAGRHASSEKTLREALNVSEGHVRGNILRDLADLIRRKPNGIREAHLLLAQSLELLPLMKYPLENSYTRHFMARVERQAGNYLTALAELIVARHNILYYLKNHKGLAPEVYAQKLYLELDYCSMLALSGDPLEAFWRGLYALVLSLKYGKKAHKVRGMILTLFSLWPEAPFEFVYKAHFGSRWNNK